MNKRKTERMKKLYINFNKHINCTHNIVAVTLVVLCFDICQNSRKFPRLADQPIRYENGTM